MVQQDPFADFPDAPPAGQPSPATQRNAAPGVIRGPAPTVDPVAAERLRIAQQAEGRAAAKEAREEQRRNEGFDATEGERKAGSFLIRALGSNASYEETGLGARSLPDQVFRDAFPTLETYFSDPNRQTADSAQDEFIAASLRQDSGAAIPPEELERQRLIYFPMPGETDPQVIEQKRQARLRAIAGLEQSAGRLAGTSKARFEELQAQLLQNAAPREATREDEAPLGLETGFDRMGRDDPFDRAQYLQRTFGVQPGQETRLVGLINANIGNPNLDMGGLRQIYDQAGVPMPAPEQAQKLLEEMRSGNVGPTTGIDTSAAQREYVEGLDQSIAAVGSDPDSAIEAGTVGVASGATFGLSDEITGIGTAIGAALQGENPLVAYEVGRDRVRRFRDRAYEESPVSSIAGEIGGALVTGGRLFGAPRNALQAAGTGAVEGGIAGFGYGEGAQNSLLGAAVGVPTGAAIGAGLQAGGNKVQRMLGRNRPDAAEVQSVVDAGERTGVPVRRADVDPAMRGPRADLMQTDSRQTIRDVEGEDLAAMETALMRELGGETADGPGATFGRGERIQSGTRNVVQQARRRAGRLYEQARAESQNVRVEPRTALRVVNEQIAELEQAGRNANKAQIEFLEGLRGDISRSGGVGIDVLRGQRTNLRGNISTNNLSMTDVERRANLVLNALSEDIKQGLQGNPALGKFRQADEIWRKQSEFQNNIVRKLVGTDSNPVPAETAARRVQAFIGSDYRRAKALFDELGPDARKAIREQVAVSLGRGRNGEFSLANFITHTSEGRGGMLQPQTMRLLFGEDGMQAINDLRTLAGAKRAAAEPGNTSNTGSIVKRAGAGLRRLLLGGAGFGIVMDAGGGMGVGTAAAAGATLMGEVATRLGRERTLRLLLNPDFTKWLKSLPNSSEPRVIDGAFNRLRSIASRTPGMVVDVQALERALIGAANDNASRIAAEPTGTDNVGRGEQQPTN